MDIRIKIDKIKPFKSIKNDASITEWKDFMIGYKDMSKVIQSRASALSQIAAEMGREGDRYDSDYLSKMSDKEVDKLMDKLNNLNKKLDKENQRLDKAIREIGTFYHSRHVK